MIAIKYHNINQIHLISNCLTIYISIYFQLN